MIPDQIERRARLTAYQAAYRKTDNGKAATARASKKSATKRRKEKPETVRRQERESKARSKARNPEAYDEKERQRNAFYRQANKSAVAERAKLHRAKYKAADPVGFAKKKANRQRRARQHDPVRFRALEVKSYRKRWLFDPVAMAASIAVKTAKRRALKKMSEGTYVAADILRIHILQNGKCAYCRILLRKTGTHVDHITPLSRGGSNAKQNLQLLCPPCNLSKGAKDPIKFSRERGLLI